LKTPAFDHVTGRVSPLFNGPPVGWPVQYRVSGDDPEQVRYWAHRVAEVIAADPVIRDVVFDWNEPAKMIRVRVNQDAARMLGVSSERLATAIHTVVSGQSITSIYPSMDPIEVVVRAVEGERSSLETLRSLQILLDDGRAVPLSQVAVFDYGLEQPLVWRENRQPTITVKATMYPRLQAVTVAERLKPALNQLATQMPPRFGIATGGIVEKSEESNGSLAAVAPVMLLVMVTVLMVQLQSFQRLFLVFSVAPLGLIGVVMALLPTGTPMGFVAILGCIALIGMIIRNSVILIDQIDTMIKMGTHPWVAVIESTCHRLRPIVLTAMAAILGMIPIAFDVFWGPMAYAVMGGLAVATVLTLFFLPALYVAWFRIREPETA
jgi:multidrug efflux pump subunit AcrB